VSRVLVADLMETARKTASRIRATARRRAAMQA
jgi:hypothetical protein